MKMFFTNINQKSMIFGTHMHINERKKLLDKMTDLNTEEEGISQDEEDDLKDFLRTLLKDGKINLLKETQSIEDKTDA